MPSLLAAEREHLLRPAWQVLGHEAELRVPGDYLSGDLGGERVLIVRAERDRLHAFRNTCRRSPHALVSERSGELQSAIRCATHALTYTFDGQLVEGKTPGDLTPLEFTRRGQLLLARGCGTGGRTAGAGAVLGGVREPRAVRRHGPGGRRGLEGARRAVARESAATAAVPAAESAVRGAPARRGDPAGDADAPGRTRLRRFDFARRRPPARRGAREAWRREIDAWVSRAGRARRVHAERLISGPRASRATPAPSAAALARVSRTRSSPCCTAG